MTESIAARLLRIIFSCYFVVTVVVTALQLGAEYTHTRNRVEKELQAMQQTFGPGIADAMWRYNDDILRGILSGMSEMPAVVGVKIADEHGALVRAVGTVVDADGTRKRADSQGRLATVTEGDGFFQEMFSRDFPVVFIDEKGESKNIGTWTVYSDQHVIVRQVEYGFLLILVNSVIKTLALWFIFLLVVRRWLGRPLRQLTDFVGHINVDNLGDPIVLQDKGRNELHLLAAKLNEMTAKIRAGIAEKADLVARLQDEQAKIRQLNESLEQRVAERTMELEHDRQQLATTNAQLAQALDTVQRAQEELARNEKLTALGSMVAGVAHELNTPIGNSLMAASTLNDNVHRFAASFSSGLKRSEVDRFIHEASTVSELLTRNIIRAADLVTSFKQIAVDQTSSQRRAFDVATVVRENIDALMPSLRKTPYTVVQQVDAGLAMDSYPGPLGQVLINLINNAVIHGFHRRDHGTITIEGRRSREGWIDMVVTDDGAGIAPDILNRIYDPFFTTKLGAGSTGLGLNITHNIVTGLLGGQIQVDSTPGEGARFTISVPCVAPVARDPA
ncbi:HAMP domain-containing protein [Duganella sp. FT92W]|uniref:histidine kinase n=1 Tax=Pseudoduganella rivuli TaxID=2666085 RepID=A0A7X2LQP7_9BURK|nr:ATP-binding protein [Pseudoduganella rivuli]MRV70351.1 HAMP domain-containing protein [Pseudoduganella rivuli]